jgi:hypothetical protein
LPPPSQALLRRLEVRLSARGASSEGTQSLLRRLFPKAPAGHPIDRYPVRVFLCAYMVLEHPQVVFNGKVGSAARRPHWAALSPQRPD